jgi:hypothetical protein
MLIFRRRVLLGLVQHPEQLWMSHQFATMVGSVQTPLSLRALAGQLASTGLQLKVQERCYPNGDSYIRIHEGDDFTLQQVRPGSYLAEGMSTSITEMCAAASRVSLKLVELSFRHQFEVRDGRFRLVYCVQRLSLQPADDFPGVEDGDQWPES